MAAHCGNGIPILVKLLECALAAKKSLRAWKNPSKAQVVIGEHVVKSLKECALRCVIGPFESSKLVKRALCAVYERDSMRFSAFMPTKVSEEVVSNLSATPKRKREVSGQSSARNSLEMDSVYKKIAIMSLESTPYMS